MIKSDNGSLGLEIVMEGEAVRFIGHFDSETKSEIAMFAADATELVNNTGTWEIHGQRGGLISVEPQGVLLWFKPNNGRDLISLKSRDFISKLCQVLSIEVPAA